MRSQCNPDRRRMHSIEQRHAVPKSLARSQVEAYDWYRKWMRQVAQIIMAPLQTGGWYERVIDCECQCCSNLAGIFWSVSAPQHGEYTTIMCTMLHTTAATTSLCTTAAMPQVA
jgi:hypothetical protein